MSMESEMREIVRRWRREREDLAESQEPADEQPESGDEAAPEYHVMTRSELKSLLLRRKPVEHKEQADV